VGDSHPGRLSLASESRSASRKAQLDAHWPLGENVICARATWRFEILRGIKGRYISETADFDRDLVAWHEEKNHVDELLYMARNLDRLSPRVEPAELSIMLKGDEQVLTILNGSGIVELKATGVANEGGSRGVGFRVTMGVSYRAGAHNGSYVSRPEVQRTIDSGGTTTITTNRVVYTSPKRSRTWEYSKTVDVFHTDNVAQGWGASYIGVSNRKRTSGFIYRSGFARSVRDRLVLALAVADGTLDDMVTALEAERAELERI
jgi:hypothetical protein